MSITQQRLAKKLEKKRSENKANAAAAQEASTTQTTSPEEEDHTYDPAKRIDKIDGFIKNLETGNAANLKFRINLTKTQLLAENRYYELFERLVELRKTNIIQRLLKAELLEPNEVVNTKYGSTVLMIAAAQGCLETCQLLIKHKADPEQIDLNKQTSIIYAIQFCGRAKENLPPNQQEAKLKNLRKVINYLIPLMSNFDQLDITDCTPLFYAMGAGEMEALQKMVHKCSEKTLIKVATQAIKLNHSQAFKILMTAQHFPINGRYALENTLLSVAAQYSRSEIMRLLLEHKNSKEKIEVDSQNKAKATPLICASAEGSLDCVGLLLEAKADPNSTTQTGETALMAAAHHRQTHIVKKLLSLTPRPNVDAINTLGATALTLAICNNDAESIEALLSASARFDIGVAMSTFSAEPSPTLLEESSYRKTDIAHLCIFHNNIAVFKLLIQQNIINAYGKSPEGIPYLVICANHHNVECAQLLLETLKNSKTTLTSKELEAVLIHVIKYEAYAILGLILKAIEIPKSSLDQVLLEVAGEFDAPEALSLLIDAGANPNATTTQEQNTPLIFCAFSDMVRNLECLIKKGANINAQSKIGNTALIAAVQSQKINSIRCLLKHEADVNLSNDVGAPIFYAAKVNDLQIARILLEESLIQVSRKYTQDQELVLDTPISKTTNPAMVKYLRTQGFTGYPISCFLHLMLMLLGTSIIKQVNQESFVISEDDINLEEIESLLEIINPTDTISLPNRATGDGTGMMQYYPMYTYSNTTNKTTRAVILKHMLFHRHSNINREAIQRVVTLLQEVTSDFSFAKDGSLCITFQRREKEYQVSLNEAALLQILIAEKDHTGLKNPKILENFKKRLFEFSEEYKELKEAEELEILKNDALSIISVTSLKCDRHLAELTQLDTIIKSLPNNQDSNTEKLMAALQKLQQPIIEFKQKLSSTLQTYRDQMLSESTSRVELEAFVQDLKKIVIEYTDTVETPFESVKQSIHQHLELITPAAQSFEAPGLASEPKSTKADKKLEKQKKAREAEKKKIEEAAKSAVSKTDTKETDESTKDSIQVELQKEIKKIQDKPIAAAKKKQTYIPPTPSTSQGNQNTHPLSNPIDVNTRQYLPPKPRKFNELWPIADHLKAVEGRITLQNVSVSTSFEETQETKEGEVSVELLMDYNASLGSLAQALETRKNLKEKWPNRIRNVLFRHEAAFKALKKSEVIVLVKDINDNLSGISESDLLNKGSKLNLREVDSKLFLDRLNRETIPAFSEVTARKRILQSEKELELFRAFIQKNGFGALKNQNLKAAIGYSLARIGTHWGDLNKANKEYDFASKPFVLLGIEYRHHLPEWQEKVNAFIKDCLKPTPAPTNSSAGASNLSLTSSTSTLHHSHTISHSRESGNSDQKATVDATQGINLSRHSKADSKADSKTTDLQHMDELAGGFPASYLPQFSGQSIALNAASAGLTPVKPKQNFGNNG